MTLRCGRFLQRGSIGKFFVFCRIQLKFRFWLHKRCWPISWKFPLKIKSNKKSYHQKANMNGVEVMNLWQCCLYTLTLCMLGNFFKYLFFSNFSKNLFVSTHLFCWYIIWMSNNLDLRWSPHFVGLHLDPNCLHRSSTVFKIHR